jgi:hypothetical protein
VGLFVGEDDGFVEGILVADGWTEGFRVDGPEEGAEG